MNHHLIRQSPFKVLILVAVCILINMPSILAQQTDTWLTDPAHSIVFQQKDISQIITSVADLPTIHVNSSHRFQTIDGFGFSLTGGSAIVINRMRDNPRRELINELFGNIQNGIGISYLRVSIGSSDLSDHLFTYDDLPDNATDLKLQHFSIAEDQKDLIPLLKEIIHINPSLKIMASPWSAPLWMKTNKSFKGGMLKEEDYQVYANYFLKYISAMSSNGINVDAITIQNEPLHPGNNPSMYMSAKQQALFVSQYLGPLFKKNAIKTKIIIYDHNLDRLDYPLSILDNPACSQYVDGTAFHLYAGSIDAMDYVHQKYPGKSLYFTEQWINSNDPGLDGNLRWHIRNLIIGAMRNWSKNVLEWNLAADINNGPHTPAPGCDICLGGVTINGDEIQRNPSYYIVAHASKFLAPNSVRIESDEIEGMPNVAFINTLGQKVIIILNDTPETRRFNLDVDHKKKQFELSSGAVVTCVWSD
ncbi:glycoside hydrolase family 30 protein [Mucilaginibacter jinjuensis]|uniref:Glycoside hydrolase family 30 beta sandwich domain-containing protein n=1 Tax=Mucilaginibacter jinjuensis TaxID=1176721 RepID=A0ABY7TF21_9SPHI|nr:glycoside hydrolase family 30 beta sandwich domain-containing protein [Mucilaginibacter jinjuensis]WCT13777.1 glycoside hydrolase family 30 beta sandwich domain-containing protein [Mucilaginibacter jinjuensis]